MLADIWPDGLLTYWESGYVIAVEVRDGIHTELARVAVSPSASGEHRIETATLYPGNTVILHEGQVLFVVKAAGNIVMYQEGQG